MLLNQAIHLGGKRPLTAQRQAHTVHSLLGGSREAGAKAASGQDPGGGSKGPVGRTLLAVTQHFHKSYQGHVWQAISCPLPKRLGPKAWNLLECYAAWRRLRLLISRPEDRGAAQIFHGGPM